MALSLSRTSVVRASRSPRFDRVCLPVRLPAYLAMSSRLASSPPSSAATAAEATQATWIIHPVHAVNKRGNQQILVCSVYPRGLQPPRAHAYALTPGKKDVQLPSPAQPSVRELIGPQPLVASAVPVNLNETRRLVGLATPARAEVIVGFGYFDYVAHNVLDGVNFGKKGNPQQSRVQYVAVACEADAH